jgi:hypothetical protein
MKKLYVRFCGKVSFRRPLGNGEFRGASSTGPSKEKTWVIYSKDRSRDNSVVQIIPLNFRDVLKVTVQGWTLDGDFRPIAVPRLLVPIIGHPLANIHPNGISQRGLALLKSKNVINAPSSLIR